MGGSGGSIGSGGWAEQLELTPPRSGIQSVTVAPDGVVASTRTMTL
jgi:hypothetical protein